MRVWQVIRHDVTTGRDSGYPVEMPVSPLFSTMRGAQDEADRLLATLTERQRTSRVLTINPATGTYCGPVVELPTYQVKKVPVLSQVEADRRQQAFIDKAREQREAEAARLEAKVAELRGLSA